MSLRFISLAFAPLLLAGLFEAQAQEPLRLHGLYPSGVRSSLTESWGTLRFLVDNNSDVGRPARVVVFFPSQPDVRYSRDVWVPARTSLGSWLSIGPVPAAKANEPSKGREIDYLLYDLSEGKERLVLPGTEERTRSRAVMYRKREPLSILSVRSDFTQVGSPAYEDYILAHTLRTAGGMPPGVTVQPEDLLPHSAEAFEGIDHFIVASDRIVADPVGTKALRQWLHQGGKVWVMLDQVDPSVIAHLLGEETNIEVVDRTSLTAVKIMRHRDGTESAALRTFERPVEFVRVYPSEEDTILHSVNGWPASFTRIVGRGKVLFTTLGPRGWHQPRNPNTPKKTPIHEESLQLNLDLPSPLTPLEEISAEFRSKQKAGIFTTEDLRPLLDEQIGYSVMSRSTVMLILGGFLAALIALGVGLRRSSRPELVGWLAPGAALAAALLFFVLGERSRRAVPPTIAIATVTDVSAGNGEAASEGLVSFYQPDSGPTPIGSQSDALLHLNSEGLDGQIRRRVQRDLDIWEWDQLSLPAGVRGGTFRHSIPSGTIEAMGRFGESGLEGKITTPSFRNVSDLLLLSSKQQPMAIRLKPDGSFTAVDSLSSGQFLESAVLTDQQQKRQELYRKLVQGALPEHLESRDIVMAWAEPEKFPFTAREGEKTSGTTLLFIPLKFEPTAPGSQVSIPAPFISNRRVVDGDKLVTPTLESSEKIAMDLRFQMPESVSPLKLEKAILTVRVRAPGWKLVMKGSKEAGTPIIHQADSPLDAVRLELTDEKLLQLDERGGWQMSLSLDADKRSETRWKIEILSLEVQGKTASK